MKKADPDLANIPNVPNRVESFKGVAPAFKAPLYQWLSPLSELPWFPAPIRTLVWAVARIFLSFPRTLPSGLSLAPRWTWVNTTSRRQHQQKRRWDASNPPLLPPSEWSKLLEHIQCSHAIRVNIRRKRIVVASIVATREDKPLFYARRQFCRETVRVEHTYLVVNPSFRQAGIGMQITANALAVYPQMGFKEIQLDAGLTDGGLVWARLGYVPVDRRQWERVKRAVRRNFRHFPDKVKSSQAPIFLNFRDHLNLILNSPNPCFIRQILHLDREGRVKSAAGLPEAVSKLLLKNSRWRGYIRFDQADSMSCAREYITERIDRGLVRRPEWW